MLFNLIGLICHALKMYWPLTERAWLHTIEGTATKGLPHSFETQPGGQPGLMIGSRVRWVNPGQQKKNKSNMQSILI